MNNSSRHAFAAILFIASAFILSSCSSPGTLSSFDDIRTSKALILSLEQEHVPAGAEEFTVILENVTDTFVGSGGPDIHYYLDVEKKGKWYTLPFSQNYRKWSYESRHYEPGITILTVDLTRLESPLKEGNYRLMLGPDWAIGHESVLTDNIPVLYFEVK